jgi:heptosyltransferase-2
MADPARVLVAAPNWLGDAVMALPAVADVRRRWPGAQLVVAARGPVADLFRLAPHVDRVTRLKWDGRWWHRRGLLEDAASLHAADAEVAVLLPNSFASAWLARRAGIPERWGYAADLRSRLLTRGVRRPRHVVHQAAYYQHLVKNLGFDNGPLEPIVELSEAAVATARQLLTGRGWDGAGRVIVLAPGAAYGKAKQWIPSHVARLVIDLAGRGDTCVLVGTGADAPVTRAIGRAVPPAFVSRVIDLAGETTLETLAAVMRVAGACVSNDSGAMHVAAAVGVPLVAIFGPTNEQHTSPLTRSGGHSEIVTTAVWCRPCMLRECPIDHRCMTGIEPGRVRASLDRLLGGDMPR